MSGREATGAAAFEARYSILAHIVVLALVLALLVPAAWILHESLKMGQWLGILVGAAGVALFGPYALALLMRIADRRVRLRITGDAVWLPDHSQTPIPRRSIKRVSDRNLWIALYLHKPGRFPPTTRFRRFVKVINNSDTLREQYGDAWIYPALLNCSRRELLDRI